MEAIGEFIPDRADRPGAAMRIRLPQPAAVPGAAVASVDGSVAAALALLLATSESAAENVARLNFFQASDLAEEVEDLSRVVGYLQIVAAARVDRTRREAAAVEKASAGWGSGTAAGTPGWLTGWNQEPCEGEAGGDTKPEDESDAVNGVGSEDGANPRGGLAPVPFRTAGVAVSALAVSAPATVADDGYRNAAEFLRARLRIGASEAKRRLRLGAEILPRTGIAGRALPPARPVLAAAVSEGTIASRTATLIAVSLERVLHAASPESVDAMERALTQTAIENDADFLARIARRWTDALDQDGAEPSEEALRRLQGVFIRKPSHGLHHLEIFSTTDQFEQLVTVMNVATNPRLAAPANPEGTAENNAEGTKPDADAGAGAVGGTEADACVGDESGGTSGLDRRSRPQRMLDGLVGACKAALAAGDLPAAGGLRPQVMATIDYRDLLQRLNASGPTNGGTGALAFTGPVTASTIRKLACDADIIPVLLGGDGRILDVGRASRVFPPHVRKALVARDQGCAFPQCTIPASWCEAHHITYWSRGGSTGTDNGVLLCSHHHHLIHKEQWTVRMRGGTPWFIPPPHVDPGQVPRRNRYFRLD